MEKPENVNWNIVIEILVDEKRKEFVINELEKTLVGLQVNDYFIND